ncbi:MAG: M48 family metalloprotease [Candidatus Riflebacteria bacterium]|nr:M48 family metalloprotease [Candidatus Riflebacteria bacterium]
MMVTLFLPLIMLGFLSNDAAGSFLFMPWTSMIMWLALSFYAISSYIPSKLDSLISSDNFTGLINCQERLPWFLVLWILLIQALSAPGRLVLPFLDGRFQQTGALLISTTAYIILTFLLSSTFHNAFRKMLLWEQTPEEYFRARIAIPILLFPPLLLGAFFEDCLSTVVLIPGLSDLPLVVLAPFFCFFLYLLSPYLFNAAWQAVPLNEDTELFREIKKLSEQTGVRIAGVKIWNTFGEPLPNAAVVGLLDSFRYVYLTRFLVDTFSHSQKMIIVAHELGHFALGHVWTYMIFTLNIVGVTLAARLSLFLFYPEATEFLGTTGMTVMEMLLFLAVFLFIFTKLSRTSEIQADRYSVSLLGKEVFSETIDRLRDFIGTQNSKIPAWMETHPAMNERVKFVTEWSDTGIDVLKKDSFKSRLAMFFILLISIIFLFPMFPIMLDFHGIASIQPENDAKDLSEYARRIKHKIGSHPVLEEIFITKNFIRGDWINAFLGSFAFWKKTSAIDQYESDLQVFHHSVSPEITFYFNLMKFFLKILDFRTVHGVPFLDEGFNSVKIAFGFS